MEFIVGGTDTVFSDDMAIAGFVFSIRPIFLFVDLWDLFEVVSGESNGGIVVEIASRHDDDVGRWGKGGGREEREGWKLGAM